MLNKNVTNVLQQVQRITNSCVLKYPRTIMNSTAGDIILSVDMQSLDNDVFPDMAIWSLDELLNTFKMFGDDRQVHFKDNTLYIQEGQTKVEYITNTMSLLKDYDKSETIIDTTKAVPSVASILVEAVDLAKISQASKVFNDLEDVVIESRDGEITISLSSSNKFNAQANRFSLTKEAQTSKEFKISIPAENFTQLPSSEYNLQVKYNSANNAYRLLFTSTEIDNFDVVMNVKR